MLFSWRLAGTNLLTRVIGFLSSPFKSTMTVVICCTSGREGIVVLPDSVQTLVVTESSTSGDMRDIQAGNPDEFEHVRAEEHPLKWSQCDKNFSRKEQINQHEKTHTTGKSFQCDHCGKSFHKKQHRDVHEQTHTGEKPFECDQCGKWFSQKGNLNLHKKTHTGVKAFKCNYCNRCFGHKGHLNEHKRIHTGEKPFSCNQCNKRFNRKSLLRQHQETHTRENCFEFTQFDQLLNKQENTQIVSNNHTAEETLKTSDEQDKSLNCDFGDRLEGVTQETEETNLSGESCKYKDLGN